MNNCCGYQNSMWLYNINRFTITKLNGLLFTGIAVDLSVGDVGNIVSTFDSLSFGIAVGTFASAFVGDFDWFFVGDFVDTSKWHGYCMIVISNTKYISQLQNTSWLK